MFAKADFNCFPAVLYCTSAWSELLTTDAGVPGSIPGHYRKKIVGLERGPLSLVSTTEELLDRKVAAPV
jgi:hypothetical protein